MLQQALTVRRLAFQLGVLREATFDTRVQKAAESIKAFIEERMRTGRPGTWDVADFVPRIQAALATDETSMREHALHAMSRIDDGLVEQWRISTPESLDRGAAIIIERMQCVHRDLLRTIDKLRAQREQAYQAAEHSNELVAVTRETYQKLENEAKAAVQDEMAGVRGLLVQALAQRRQMEEGLLAEHERLRMKLVNHSREACDLDKLKQQIVDQAKRIAELESQLGVA